MGPFIGTVYVSHATSVDLKAFGPFDLTLGDIDGTDDISVQTDEGIITSVGNSKIQTAGELTLKTVYGSIGTATNSVRIDVPVVNLDLGAVPDSATKVNIHALQSVEVEAALSYGDIIIESDGDLTLTEGAETTAGHIFLSATGTFNLETDGVIRAREGSVIIEATAQINLGDDSGVFALATSTDAFLGSVSISINASPSFMNQTPPSNVVIDIGASSIFFGVLNISADAPDNHLKSLGDRFLAFDTNGFPSSSIHLGGNVTISAIGN